MMLNDCQRETLRCLKALDHRVEYATAEYKVLVWLDDDLYSMNADGSLGPEVKTHGKPITG